MDLSTSLSKKVLASIILLVLAILAVATWATQHIAGLDAGVIFGYAALSFSIGAIVGIVELAQRYKTAPMLAIMSGYGVVYWVFNGMISIFAFGLMKRYPELFLSNTKEDLFLQAVGSGTGAMALFRTKFLGIGNILEGLLGMFDSAIRNEQTYTRKSLILGKLPLIQSEQELAVAFNVVEIAFNFIPNLSPGEKVNFNAVIRDARAQANQGVQLRLSAVVFSFVDTVGIDRINELIASIDQELINVRRTPVVPVAAPVIPLSPATAPTPNPALTPGPIPPATRLS